MVSRKRLKEVAKAQGFDFYDLASILGLKYTTFMARLRRGYLSSNDVETLIACLELSPEQYESVFFDKLQEARQLITNS